MLDQEIRNKIDKIIKKYPEGKQKSAVIPALHIIQENNNKGWLEVNEMESLAEILEIKPIEVFEVATFYTMFNLKPVGKNVLEICHTGPCMLRGSDQIIDYVKEKLGIKVGETTSDGLFTLKTVECLGACGYAPMLQLGKFYKENLTKEKIDEIIENIKDTHI